MKTTLMLMIATFVLTSAFTCSKNPPAPQATGEAESQPAQEQMAAPAENAPPAAPAEGAQAPAAPETEKEAPPETK